MSDRVPICTIPGLVSVLVDVDVMIAPADVSKTVTRVFLQRTDNGAGDVVTAALHNATGGGGDSISVTLASTEDEQVATGTMTVEATEALYLRVSAADANSQNIRGWFEVDGTAGVTAALTNLVRVEEFLDADTGDDALIANLIAEASSQIQSHLGRAIIQATATDERLDSIGDSSINTRYFPIISIASLTENGNALVEDTDFECLEFDKLGGALVRISGGYPTAWAVGSRIITVTYDHGYASVPEVIVKAATRLVVSEYMQSSASASKRFGLTSQVDIQGGSGTYITPDELWKSLIPILAPFKRKWM